MYIISTYKSRMYRIIFKLCIIFSIVSPILPVQNNYHKYNMDQESFKLYGEDFKSVLKRFRRTSDYLKILQDKLADLKTSAKEMSLQVLHYYSGKLEERVSEIIPTTTTVSGASSQGEGPKENVYFHAHGNRRRGEPTTKAVEDSWQKIQNLDNYKVFDSQLSVAERNSLKDLGFEFAGKTIHSIIEHMSQKSANATTEKFTHAPESDEKADATTTSTHPTAHAESHKEDETETVQEEAFPSTESYSLSVSKTPLKWKKLRR